MIGLSLCWTSRILAPNTPKIAGSRLSLTAHRISRLYCGKIIYFRINSRHRLIVHKLDGNSFRFTIPFSRTDSFLPPRNVSAYCLLWGGVV